MKHTYNATIVDDTSPAPAFHNSYDLTGERFGRLVVTSFAGRGARKLLIWNCRCDCGIECTAYGYILNRGAKRSCGCLASEVTSKRSKTHGMSKSPTYKSWRCMIRRCEAPGDIAYPRYGGRGISVCDAWRSSFEAFLADMGERPSKKHQIERINNDGNYTPENCRWATRKEQARNRRNNTILSHDGKTMCIADWADYLGWTQNQINNRIYAGWSVERTLTQPIRPRRKG